MTTFFEDLVKNHAQARAIYDLAVSEDRTFTDEEDGRFRELMEEKGRLEKAIKTQNERQQRLGEYERQIGERPVLPDDPKPDGVPTRSKERRSIGQQFVDGESYQALLRRFPDGKLPDNVRVGELASMKLPARQFTRNVGRVWQQRDDPAPITTGGLPGPTTWLEFPELMVTGQWDLTLSDVVPYIPITTETVEYSRLVNYERAAAATPEGQVKPRANLEWELVREVVATIAVAAPPISRQALRSRDRLQAEINQLLAMDVDLAREEKIATRLLDDAEVSTRATGSILPATRKVLTELRDKAVQIRPVVPSAFVLAPEVAEMVDLERDREGRYFGAGPFGMGPNTLWGIPRVTSSALEGDQVLVGDFRYSTWYDREENVLRMTDSHADHWEKNLIDILCETSGLIAVMFPRAFRKFTAEAGGDGGGNGGGGNGGGAQEASASVTPSRASATKKAE